MTVCYYYSPSSFLTYFQAREGEDALELSHQNESLLDLIAGYGQESEKEGNAAGVREEAKKSGKGKGGQK